MNQITINGLTFSYEKERDLFNGLLKINGVSKKKFCEKYNATKKLDRKMRGVSS